MPATRLALSLVNAYRARSQQLHEVFAAQIRLGWRLDLNDVDGSYNSWVVGAGALTRRTQTQAVQLSRGYLDGFLTAELGTPTTAKPPPGNYIGVYRDGRPIPLDGVRVAVKVALKRGQPSPLDAGLKRALFVLSQSVDYSLRQSCLDAVHGDERFSGWGRAVRGTCGACMALAGPSGGLFFPCHPGCQCMIVPQVTRVGDRYPLPTGAAIWASKTKEEQDRAVGPEVAQAIRDGDIELTDLVRHDRQYRGKPFISQAAADKRRSPE